MLINKFKDTTYLNKSRLIFNYFRVNKNFLSNYIKLSAKIHNYFANLQYNIYIQTNLQHDYFSVKVYFKNRYIFVFTILNLKQLQLT